MVHYELCVTNLPFYHFLYFVVKTSNMRNILLLMQHPGQDLQGFENLERLAPHGEKGERKVKRPAMLSLSSGLDL